jgi:ubiquinone biosynthesis monooxygenase Coq7
MIKLRQSRFLSTVAKNAHLINMSKMKLSNAQKDRIHQMMRVNQAGELGAVQIYAGQQFILRNTSTQPLLQHMAQQEQHHYDTFNSIVSENRIKPTIMWPLWRVAGFSLGAITAALGKEGAMACTEAVETVIGQHYNDQLRELEDFRKSTDCDETKTMLDHIKGIVKQFRDEELEHLDTAVEHDSQKAPLRSLLSGVIKVGCKTAIAISERV